MRCLRENDQCRGEVSERASFAGTGTLIAECAAHLDRSIESNQRHREIYPDSPNAPSWFDPTDAGERWDDD